MYVNGNKIMKFILSNSSTAHCQPFFPQKSTTKGRGGSPAWGLCLKFHPKRSKFGTVDHLGSKT